MGKISQSDGAPHVIVDYIVSAGHIGGNVLVHVGMEEARPSLDGTTIEKVVVSSAHLRMTRLAAVELANSLMRAIDILDKSGDPTPRVAARPN